VVLLCAEDLAQRYGTSWVLDGIDLTVEAGDTVLIQGRSGTGKTTLLNILAGLETPTRGTVEIQGEAIDQLGEAERARLRRERIGFVFQDFNLVPDLTVFENVLLPMELTGRAGRREQAADLVAEFGLKQRAEAFPENLSGGERQRVGIARALANEPALVLADEPTANLDEVNARRVLRLLTNVAGPDRALVLASHDPLATMYLGRGYRVEGGQLVDDLREPHPGIAGPEEADA
jgi:putative ABC transport system ATP-binding protein